MSLFEPVAVGSLTLKNRLVMAPMSIDGLCTLQGGFSARAVEYMVARARGGVGLIITGLVKVEGDIECWQWNAWPTIGDSPRHFVQTAAELTERVHAHGTAIFLQITMGEGRTASRQYHVHHPVAPSPVPNFWEPDLECRELSTEEVEQLVQRMSEAAAYAKLAGFDGVEVHAMHEGFLLDQFTQALTNQRTDRFGGDLEGRLTLPREVVRSIKEACGQDFPVSLRYGVKSFIKDWNKGALPGEEFVERGRDLDEGLRVAQLLEAAGYDAFNADGGSHEAWYWPHPPLYMDYGCYLPLTEELKKVVSAPVIVAGRMDDPGLAERAVANGQADLVALGRALLADEDWPRKTRLGRTEDIRPCIGCHECIERGALMKPLSCAVNPACGREVEYAVSPSPVRRRVLVAGGGVAGMEAARVAALRGHHVTLIEAQGQLGGQLIPASMPAFKRPIRRLLEWYKGQLTALGVDITFGKTVTAEVVGELAPDVVVAATGAEFAPSPPCGDGASVTSAPDVLCAAGSDGAPLGEGQSYLIVGGGVMGCETALWLAQHGHRVTIVEQRPRLLEGGTATVPTPNRMMLLDLLPFHGVTVMTEHCVVSVQRDGVVTRPVEQSPERGAESAGVGQAEVFVAADIVVLATGYRSDTTLVEALAGIPAELAVVGDAQRPRTVMAAIWDAYEVALGL